MGLNDAVSELLACFEFYNNVTLCSTSHSVKWIPNLWELRQAEAGQLEAAFPPAITRMAELSHLLISVNSAANLYIYLAKGPV